MAVQTDPEAAAAAAAPPPELDELPPDVYAAVVKAATAAAELLIPELEANVHSHAFDGYTVELTEVSLIAVAASGCTRCNVWGSRLVHGFTGLWDCPPADYPLCRHCHTCPRHNEAQGPLMRSLIPHAAPTHARGADAGENQDWMRVHA